MSIQELVGVRVDGCFNLRNVLIDHVAKELGLSMLMGAIYQFTELIEKEQCVSMVKIFEFKAVKETQDRVQLIVSNGGEQLGYIVLKVKEDALEIVMARQTPLTQAKFG